MRFCDLFVKYKIESKEIKSSIPFIKLPMHRKIAIIIIFVSAVMSLIMALIKKPMIAIVLFAVASLLMIVFVALDSTKKNQSLMLNDHYLPYSKERMTILIRILMDYDIDIKSSEKIDLLITEAQNAQSQSDCLAPIKKPLNALKAAIIPVVVFVAQKIGNNVTMEEMIFFVLYYIVIALMIFAVILAISSGLKQLIYRDYNIYNDFIYDLRQIKLFYCNSSR